MRVNVGDVRWPEGAHLIVQSHSDPDSFVHLVMLGADRDACWMSVPEGVDSGAGFVRTTLSCYASQEVLSWQAPTGGDASLALGLASLELMKQITNVITELHKGLPLYVGIDVAYVDCHESTCPLRGGHITHSPTCKELKK